MALNHFTFSKLPSLGIQPLTGEACALSMRTLCDLNEDGTRLMCEYLGLPAGTRFADAWNSSVNGKPALGSVMIDRDAFPALVRFALRMHYDYVCVHRLDSTESVAFHESDILDNPRIREVYVDSGEMQVYRKHRSAQPSVGSRNVHAMSGRTA